MAPLGFRLKSCPTHMHRSNDDNMLCCSSAVVLAVVVKP